MTAVRTSPHLVDNDWDHEPLGLAVLEACRPVSDRTSISRVTRRAGLLVGLLVFLAFAPATVARAQPDHTATLTAANPKFTWEGSGTGVPDQVLGLLDDQWTPCSGGPLACDSILFKVEAAGVLALSLESTTGVEGPEDPTSSGPIASLQDLDGWLYKSNEAGEPQGDLLSDSSPEGGERDCTTTHPSETCKVPLRPGLYVLEVDFWLAVAAAYVGTAELMHAEPAAAPPQPPQPPQPPPRQAEQKRQSAANKRQACRRKAKRIQNKRKRAKAMKRCNRSRG